MTMDQSATRNFRPAAILAAALSLFAPLVAHAAAGPCTMAPTGVYDHVSPAVVSISATSINPYDRNERMSRVSGSGMIIDPSGLILTNAHVVFARQIISVTLDDGSTLPAHIVGIDPVFDLAIVRIPVPPSGTLPVATLGDSDGVRVGDQVFVIGNPLGLDQTMSRGIVSSINRLLPDVPYSVTEPLIQTDAPINPGNSGGPLVNDCGQVIGITTGMLPQAENIGFAIPASLVRDVVPQLMKFGRVVRPWLGVQGQFVTNELKSVFRIPLVDGLLVEVVEPGSPADIAEISGGILDVTIAGQELLLGGDIITKINGATVATPDQFEKVLNSLHVGSDVVIDVFRDGKTTQVKSKLPERPVLPQDVRGGASAKQKDLKATRTQRRGF